MSRKNEDKADPIKMVYERFKHLDALLSDKEWLKADDKIHACCHDLWYAIKLSLRKDGER